MVDRLLNQGAVLLAVVVTRKFKCEVENLCQNEEDALA